VFALDGFFSDVHSFLFFRHLSRAPHSSRAPHQTKPTHLNHYPQSRSAPIVDNVVAHVLVGVERTCNSLRIFYAYTLPCPFTHTLSPTHTHTLSLSCTRSHSLSPALSLSLSHHTHTLSLIHAQTRSACVTTYQSAVHHEVGVYMCILGEERKWQRYERALRIVLRS
jgi:hypothetical protein